VTIQSKRRTTYLAETADPCEPDGCTPPYKFSFSSQAGHVSTGIALAKSE